MNNSLPELPLRDIHLPASISWWPPALGWWLLLGIILLAIALTSFLLWNRFKPTLKKHAKKQLKSIENMFQQTENSTLCLTELSVFLRQTAMRRNQSATVAGLTGSAWLTLLDQNLETPEFSHGSGQILLKGPYQPDVERDEVVQIIQLCHKWVDRL